MMNISEKQKIAAKLANYVNRHDSQNKAARSLKGVSSATISQVLKQNWDLISDEMWRNIAAQIGYMDHGWISVETRDFKFIHNLLDHAREYSGVFACTGEAGTGKTYACRQYSEQNKRSYLLRCNDYWNKRTFLQELLSSLGRDHSGYTINEMMSEVVRILKKQNAPEIILDEVDKLSDQLLYFFITLYNQLEDHCAIVMFSTNHLQKRIERGIKLNKKGYKEIYSRIGRKFIELDGLTTTDIAAVCYANNITNKERVREIIDDSEGDLRRVKNKINGLKRGLNN